MSAPNSFEPFGQKERFGSRPGDVGAPNTFAAIVFLCLLGGISILSCGGLGYFFATQGSDDVAEAESAEILPARAPAVRPLRKTEAKIQVPPPLPELPSVPPTHFAPPPFVPPAPLNPSPPALPPTEPPANLPTASPVAPPARPPTAIPQTDDEKLTALLAQLNDPQRSKPLFLPLVELERLPVQENRRAEVARALEPHFRSTDTGTLVQITKLAATWGTDANAESLAALLEHENALVRWNSLRALAKLSPTEATAARLVAKIGEPASGPALRDAFKSLGEVGELALLRQLDESDAATRREAVGLLGDVGTEMSRPVLETMAADDADFGVKARARRALQQLDERKASSGPNP